MPKPTTPKVEAVTVKRVTPAEQPKPRPLRPSSTEVPEVVNKADEMKPVSS